MKRLGQQVKGQNVKVRLHSSIQHPNQQLEIHELMAIGERIDKAGKAYLRFNEEIDGQTVRTIVKLDEQDAQIMRNGAIQMRLPFRTSEATIGAYGNGPLTMHLHVRTETLQFEEQQNRNGRFHVKYELHADQSILGTYEITITYSEGTT